MNALPIAFTYEADVHCAACAVDRFGSILTELHAGWSEYLSACTDSEGNEVGAIFPWDEWWNAADEREYLTCGDCHSVIATVESPEEVM